MLLNLVLVPLYQRGVDPSPAKLKMAQISEFKSNLKAKIGNLLDEEYLEKANVYLQKLTYFAIGYPRFKADDVERKFIGPNARLQEIRLFSLFSTKLKLSHLVWYVLFSSIVCRDLFYIQHSLVHFRDISNTTTIKSINRTNLRISSEQTFVRIGCLETNCKKLSPTSNDIGQDLSYLPLVSICMPSLRPLYTCVHDLDTFGLQAISVGTYFVILFALILPFRVYLCPSWHETSMYSIAPQAILRTNCEFIRRELVGVRRSLINFYQRYVDGDNLSSLLTIDATASVTRHTHGRRNGICEAMRNSRRYSRRVSDFRTKLIDIHREQCETNRLSADFSSLNHQTRAYIEDCLPITRTEWWRKMSVQRTCLIFVLIMSMFVGIFALIASALTYLKFIKTHYLIEMDNYIESTNCAVWYTSDSDRFTRAALRNAGPLSRLAGAVKLVEFAPAFNTMLFLVVGLIATPLVFSMSLPLSQALICVEELYMRIAEAMSRLQLAIEYTLMLKSIGADKTGTAFGNDFEFLFHDCEFDLVRKAMRHNVQHRNGFVYLKSFRRTRTKPLPKLSYDRHWDPLNEDNFVSTFIDSNLAKYGDNLDPYLSLMTKTILNIRILIDIIEKSSENLSNMLGVTYALNYGLILINLAYNRKAYSSSDSTFPVAVGCFVYLLVNFIISFASSVQTKSTKVMHLMWQLIAASSDFTDIRVKHMRHLFIKQIAVLSQEGGMPLKAFGIKVTYAHIIEATIWTFTLIVMALSVR